LNETSVILHYGQQVTGCYGRKIRLSLCLAKYHAMKSPVP